MKFFESALVLFLLEFITACTPKLLLIQDIQILVKTFVYLTQMISI